MKRRIRLTESQFKRVIEYRTKEIQNKEVLEEGPKEWMLAGLMTLASLAGLSQTKDRNLTPEDIRKAELVQNKLENGDKEILNLFDSTNIDLNNKNLEKLKNIDLEDASVDVFKTTSKTATKSHLKQGYVLSDIKVYSDTILKKGDAVYMGDTLTLDFNSDAVFKTGTFELTQNYKQELSNTINDITKNNGIITKITIESSTDTEPIKMGNEKLADLRSNSIVNFLDSLNFLDSDNIDVNNLPNQGPNVYSRTMSTKERQEARQQTSQYRYVKVTIEYEMEFKVPNPITIEEVVNNYKYEMIKASPKQDDASTYTFKGKSPKNKPMKQPKCKKVKINNKLTQCPIDL